MSTSSFTLPEELEGGRKPKADARAKQFGTDLLYADDLVVGQNGDYVELEGIDALRQAIFNRLITRPGTYVFVPEYGVGIESYLKRKQTPAIINELREAIRSNLLRDSRIDSVLQVVTEPIAGEINGLKIGISIRASGKALRFRPFEFTREA